MANAARVDDLGAEVGAEEIEASEFAREVRLRVEQRAQLCRDVGVAGVEGGEGGADFGYGGGFVEIRGCFGRGVCGGFGCAISVAVGEDEGRHWSCVGV